MGPNFVGILSRTSNHGLQSLKAIALKLWPGGNLKVSLVHFSCPLLLVILSQNLERPSRIVATEIFFLKWLRSCSNFVRGISVMKLSEKLHTTMGLKCTILWSEPSQYFLKWLRSGGDMTRTFV